MIAGQVHMLPLAVLLALMAAYIIGCCLLAKWKNRPADATDFDSEGNQS